MVEYRNHMMKTLLRKTISNLRRLNLWYHSSEEYNPFWNSENERKILPSKVILSIGNSKRAFRREKTPATFKNESVIGTIEFNRNSRCNFFISPSASVGVTDGRGNGETEANFDIISSKILKCCFQTFLDHVFSE